MNWEATVRGLLASFAVGLAVALTIIFVGLAVLRCAFTLASTYNVTLGYGAGKVLALAYSLLLLCVVVEGLILGFLVAVAISWRGSKG